MDKKLELIKSKNIEKMTELINNFCERFSERTQDTRDFLNINEIDDNWSQLQSETHELYEDMVGELISSISEGEMIAQKKTEFKEYGIKLKTDKSDTQTLTTVNGKIKYSRYVLRPVNKKEREVLEEITGKRSVIPLDDCLGVNNLPFKITPQAMVITAFWAQNQVSYQRAEEALMRFGVKINDDTIRHVTNYVGNIVFQNDSQNANEATAKLESCQLKFPQNKPGTLYIQADGAALNTREKNDEGSTWRENKLGEVFSTDNIYFWKNKKGERQHQILSKEYVSYLGSADEFKKHLFSCALRNGYGQYENTVILSDGATWIRKMAEEFFSDAQQILDYFHLCENVNEYAKAMFSGNEAIWKPWAKRICDMLKESEYENVLLELEPYKDRKFGNCNINLYGYINNNRNNIDYKTYISKGYFVGSGAIESGNKLVLQQRLKQSGMRWNVSTAQPLLTLKAKAESVLWTKDVLLPVLVHFDVA